MKNSNIIYVHVDGAPAYVFSFSLGMLKLTTVVYSSYLPDNKPMRRPLLSNVAI